MEVRGEEKWRQEYRGRRQREWSCWEIILRVSVLWIREFFHSLLIKGLFPTCWSLAVLMHLDGEEEKEKMGWMQFTLSGEESCNTVPPSTCSLSSCSKTVLDSPQHLENHLLLSFSCFICIHFLLSQMGLFIGKHYGTSLCSWVVLVWLCFASCRSQRLPAACSKGLSQEIISTHLNTDCILYGSSQQHALTATLSFILLFVPIEPARQDPLREGP